MLNLKVELGIDLSTPPASARIHGKFGPQILNNHYLWCFLQFDFITSCADEIYIFLSPYHLTKFEVD